MGHRPPLGPVDQVKAPITTASQIGELIVRGGILDVTHLGSKGREYAECPHGRQHGRCEQCGREATERVLADIVQPPNECPGDTVPRRWPYGVWDGPPKPRCWPRPFRYAWRIVGPDLRLMAVAVGIWLVAELV